MIYTKEESLDIHWGDCRPSNDGKHHLTKQTFQHMVRNTKKEELTRGRQVTWIRRILDYFYVFIIGPFKNKNHIH